MDHRFPESLYDHSHPQVCPHTSCGLHLLLPKCTGTLISIVQGNHIILCFDHTGAKSKFAILICKFSVQCLHHRRMCRYVYCRFTKSSLNPAFSELFKSNTPVHWRQRWCWHILNSLCIKADLSFSSVTLYSWSFTCLCKYSFQSLLQSLFGGNNYCGGITHTLKQTTICRDDFRVLGISHHLQKSFSPWIHGKLASMALLRIFFKNTNHISANNDSFQHCVFYPQYYFTQRGTGRRHYKETKLQEIGNRKENERINIYAKGFQHICQLLTSMQ